MPTLRQKKAIEKVLESHGQLAVSKAMLEAGFAPTTAKNPIQLTESKAWKELVDDYIPDELLAKIHLEGLNATKLHSSLTEPDQEVPDYPTRKGYLELGYKVKGRIQQPESTTNQTNIGEIKVVFQRKEEND